MNEYLSLLRRRPEFRYLWFAQMVSLLGDWFNTIATVILVSRYTDSGVAVGFLFIARALPPFALGPIAGMVADRLNRKTILIVSDLLRAVIVLGFLLVNDSSLVWLIYALTVAQFSVSAFFEPARSALLPQLVVPGKELLIANTLGSATWSAMLAFGAAIGGFAAGVFGTTFAISFDSLTFILAAFLVWRIRVDAQPERDATAEIQGGWADIKEGIQYVTQRPPIGVVTLVKGLSQVGTVDIMIALYAERVFRLGNEGAYALGGFYTAFGIGALLGPVIGNRLGDSSDRFLQNWILYGFVLMPVSWFMLGIAPVFSIAVLGMMLRGMGGSINWTYSNVLIQTKVPDKVMGRVFALDFSVFTLSMAISVWSTGFMVDTLDLNPRTMATYLALGSVVPIMLWSYFIRGRLAPAGIPNLAATGQD